MKLAEIVVFPVKSLRGVSVDRWPMEKTGLRWDRRWMLVDERGRFLSQRSDPSMALIDVGVESEALIFGAPGRRELRVEDLAGGAVDVEIWRKRVRARLVSPDADAWFSEALGRSARLVVMPSGMRRKPGSSESRAGDRVGFADSDPVLIASEASLQDLNARLFAPIPMRRFRANLVLEGAQAYAEDGFDEVRVGDVQLRRTRRCGRCSVTTIDIETGRTGEEPLRTLATYRRFGRKVCFGTYYVPDRLGVVSVGDDVRAMGPAREPSGGVS